MIELPIPNDLCFYGSEFSRRGSLITINYVKLFTVRIFKLKDWGSTFLFLYTFSFVEVINQSCPNNELKIFVAWNCFIKFIGAYGYVGQTERKIENLINPQLLNICDCYAKKCSSVRIKTIGGFVAYCFFVFKVFFYNLENVSDFSIRKTPIVFVGFHKLWKSTSAKRSLLENNDETDHKIKFSGIIIKKYK